MKLHKHFDTLFHVGTAAGLSDGQLLGRFVGRSGMDAEAEAAFAALVDRHGAMVLRVCRQVLGHAHDAEDAAQATFLVLARSAGSIGRRESVASWLHGVALRVAAKARQADGRRRERERRASERMAAQNESGVEADHELYHQLHDELSQLPESFRSPLVLCYLEGLTQEQAAAQLRCPLGTVQSRLARGRAKLKARLEKRGVSSAPALVGSALQCLQPSPAPETWVEATVRLGLQFLGQSAANGAGAIALARAVLRSMALAKLKVTAVMGLGVVALVSGAAAWTLHGTSPAPSPQRRAVNAALADGLSAPAQAPFKTPAEPDGTVKRTVRGIVRDELGRPVPKAWIGSSIEPMLDVWALVGTAGRLRMTQSPYRDAQGNVVPAGPLGHYYEYRGDDGKWLPVNPTDIRRYDSTRFPAPVMSKSDAEAVRKAPKQSPFQIRVAKSRRRMVGFTNALGTAPRADDNGNFEVDVTLAAPDETESQVHIASPDFLREAVHVVRRGDPENPVEITLQPTRPVRARVVQEKNDELYAPLDCDVYADEAVGQNPGDPDENHVWGRWWGGNTSLIERSSNATVGTQRFQINLPAGRYLVRFRSTLTDRPVPIVVPPGDGPVDLPDIHLKALAWLKMIGKPAAEIEAIDLDGQPVKLADYRGKVVVLAFWPHTDPNEEIPSALVRLHNRFKNRPLAILAVHDASITSAQEFRATAVPILERHFANRPIPIRLLLDRAPTGRGNGPYGLRAGDPDSGCTADIYEVVNPTTFVIDQAGRLSFAVAEKAETIETFSIGAHGYLVQHTRNRSRSEPEDVKADADFAVSAIERALEERFGLRRPGEPETDDPLESVPLFPLPSAPHGPVTVRGRVVATDGKPIAGARIAPILFAMRETEITTTAAGAFSFTVDEPHPDVSLKVEAPGLAMKVFWMYFREKGQTGVENDRGNLIVERNGLIAKSLQMGPGATVIGRVIRGGIPVAKVTMVLQYPKSIMMRIPESLLVEPFADREATTDEDGRFRISNVAANLDGCSIYAKPGSLPNSQTVAPRAFSSGKDGTVVELADFEMRPGRTLAGRVILADGKALPPTAKLVATAFNAGDRIVELTPSGRFEVPGLPDGPVCITITLKKGIGVATDIPGYRLSPKNKCLDPTFPDRLEGAINGDITDLTILLEPGEAPEAKSIIPYGVDPSRVADFEEAKAGPITGVPQR